MTTIQDMYQGTGFYPAVHALWHLKALGVAQTLQPFSSPTWEAMAAAPKVRVALLDTAVDLDHPNLTKAINHALARDFSVHEAGIFAVEHPADPSPRAALTLPSVPGSAVQEALYARLRAEIAGQGSWPKCRPIRPSAHGTAMAGLICGQPAKVTLVRPAWAGDTTRDAAEVETILPYAGVDPFCELIPISCVLPEPEMLEALLTYTQLVKPQVVVIAAHWADGVNQSADPAWAPVIALLQELSQTAIILCAAGNSGPAALAFPASLADGVRIHAVMACRADGTPTTYSAQTPGALPGLGVEAPKYDHAGVVIDPWARTDPRIATGADPWLAEQGVTPVQIETPSDLISTDCRGGLGYNPSPYRHMPPTHGPHLEIHSLYCKFSGSSAATALAAGLVALALQSPGPGQSGPGLFNLDRARALVQA